VFWHEPTAASPQGEGFWVVTRYEDVRDVQLTPEVFSSETAGGRRGGGTGLADLPVGTMINHSDDPKHKALRSLVNKGFTRAAILRLEDDLRRRARGMIAAFPEDDPFDFVTAFARELPLQAICMILGVPQEDRGHLCELVDQGVATPSPEILAPEYHRQISDYGRSLIEAKRARPGDDILSTVIEARLDGPDGRRLTDKELLGFFQLMFPAGAETTRGAIAGGLKALIEHPEQMSLLRREPRHMASAIEEIVRWTTPSIYKRRTVAQETEFRGHRMHVGDKLTFWEMSANRDERVFADPFRFDVTRSPNPHLGFGHGVHVCLGSMLARLELRIALEELLASVAEFRLAGEVDWMPSNRLLGLRRLPLRIRRLRQAA
jgi:cytochrome P450